DQVPTNDSYTVEPGDTLSAIAQDELGAADQWPEIWAANRSQISNPDLIFPDQEIELPTATTPPAPREASPPVPAPQPSPDAQKGADEAPRAQSAPESRPEAD